MKYLLLIVVFFIGFSFVLPGVVVGQAGAGVEAPQATLDNPPFSITAGLPTRDSKDNPADFIQTIFNVYGYAQLVAVALAAIMITLGGINIAVSGAIDRQAEGKDMIKSAIFGLVLLFGANLILRTINPSLTTLKAPAIEPKLQIAYEPCTKGQIPEGTIEDKKKEAKKANCLLPCGAGKTPTEVPPECYVAPPEACAGPQVLNCFPDRVEIAPGTDKENGYDFLTQANFLTYANCRHQKVGIPDQFYPCKFEDLKGGGFWSFFGSPISEGKVKNGLVVYRYPLYRSSYTKPSAGGRSFLGLLNLEEWPATADLGPGTVRCLAYAYAGFDNSGVRQQWKKLQVGSPYEHWKQCNIDFSDPSLAGLGGSDGAGGAEPTVSGAGRVQTYTEGLFSHDEAYKALLDAGVNVWSSKTGFNNCKTVPPCNTSLEGIPGFVVGRLILIKKSCNCGITVNGGTEKPGHSANTEHGPGNPVVDIAADSNGSRNLAKYLLDNWKLLNITKVLMHPNLQSRYKEFQVLCDQTKAMGLSSCNDPGENHFHIVFGG